MVHRTTFYKHFEDKYHLLSYTLENIKEQLFENLQKREKTSDLKAISIEINETIMKFLNDNKPAVDAIIKNNDDEKFYTIIKESFERTLKDFFIELKNEKLIAYDVPVQVLTTFIVGGFSNLILYQLKNSKNLKITDLYTYIEKIVNHLID